MENEDVGLINYLEEIFGNARTYEVDGHDWFVARDVCNVGGYANSRSTIANHIAESDKKYCEICDINGRKQTHTLVKRFAAYKFFLTSMTNKAKEMRTNYFARILGDGKLSSSYARVGDIELLASKIKSLSEQLEELSYELLAVASAKE